MARILAIDYGERRVGLALSDERAVVAADSLPTIDRKTLRRRQSLESEISRLAQESGAAEIVVGLPINMDGSLGESARKVLQFVETLKKKTGLKVHTWDERLTTVIAQRAQNEINLPRKKRRQKGRLDATSALVLLQNYLNSRAPGIE